MDENLKTIERLTDQILDHAKLCNRLIYSAAGKDGSLKRIEKELNDILISASIAARLIKQQRQREG